MSSKIPLWGCSLNVFVIVIVFVFAFLIGFVGQVMFSHHSDQMSQRSKVSKKFVIVIVFVFAFVFVGQVIFSHHSDQMSHRSQVSRIAPLECSLMEVHR